LLIVYQCNRTHPLHPPPWQNSLVELKRGGSGQPLPLSKRCFSGSGAGGGTAREDDGAAVATTATAAAAGGGPDPCA